MRSTAMAILIAAATALTVAALSVPGRAQDAPVQYRVTGEYAKNCTSCRREGSQLTCRCETLRMTTPRTSAVDLTECPFTMSGETRVVALENWDGQLRCKK